jgi:hypothetical protein
LIVVKGLIKGAEDETVQIKSLNLGPATPILVTTQTISISSTFHHLIRAGSLFVRTINGGEEGDILILTGDVFLRRGGNISKQLRILEDEATLLVFTNGLWVPFRG